MDQHPDIEITDAIAAAVVEVEIDALLADDSRAGRDALALLGRLRIRHWTASSDVFAVPDRDASAMGWSHERYARARRLLVERGMLVVMPTGLVRGPLVYRWPLGVAYQLALAAAWRLADAAGNDAT